MKRRKQLKQITLTLCLVAVTLFTGYGLGYDNGVVAGQTPPIDHPITSYGDAVLPVTEHKRPTITQGET